MAKGGIGDRGVTRTLRLRRHSRISPIVDHGGGGGGGGGGVKLAYHMMVILVWSQMPPLHYDLCTLPCMAKMVRRQLLPLPLW